MRRSQMTNVTSRIVHNMVHDKTQQVLPWNNMPIRVKIKNQKLNLFYFNRQTKNKKSDKKAICFVSLALGQALDVLPDKQCCIAT